MVKSMTAAITGLRSHQSKMDVISNNIANVNTWGFKSKSTNFADALYQNVMTSAEGDPAAGALGGTNASQLGYGVNVGSITTNHITGSWGYTGFGMNAMINGSGFYIVGNMIDDVTNGVPAADLTTSNFALSRVGIFAIDGNGYLVDDAGNYVYGFVETEQPIDPADPALGTHIVLDTENLRPIQIPLDPDTAPAGSPAGTPGTERYKVSVEISQDGSITGITTESEKIFIGQIAVASVENVSGLMQDAGYLYQIGPNSGQVEAIQTVANTTGAILSGYLEMSNVDLATDMANMITTQRGYQANSKIITVTDEMLEQLVNMKR